MSVNAFDACCQPGFAAVVIATLALGIARTRHFSVVNAVLLGRCRIPRPIDSHRLPPLPFTEQPGSGFALPTYRDVESEYARSTATRRQFLGRQPHGRQNPNAAALRTTRRTFACLAQCPCSADVPAPEKILPGRDSTWSSISAGVWHGCSRARRRTPARRCSSLASRTRLWGVMPPSFRDFYMRKPTLWGRPRLQTRAVRRGQAHQRFLRMMGRLRRA